MRKDDFEQKSYCEECMNEGNQDTDPNSTTLYSEDDCCCCCCDCVVSGNEDNHCSPHACESFESCNIEDEKKALISSLSIARTNREPVSIQNVLQFIEALTHSSDFLRRYNMQEDFCVGCLLAEPSCDCCTNGMSTLSINDSACETCAGSNTSSNQEAATCDCPECSPGQKASSSNNLVLTARRARRRARQPRDRLMIDSTQTSQSERNVEPNKNSNSCNSDCAECQQSLVSASQTQSSRESSLNYEQGNGYEDCACGTSSGRQETTVLPPLAAENKCLCDDCARESCSSCSCTSDCEDCGGENVNTAACTDCEILHQADGVLQHEIPRTRHTTFPSKHQANTEGRGRRRSKRMKTSNNTPPRNEFSNGKGNDRCLCNDCRASQESSEESCDDCDCHPSKDKNFKKK